MRKKKNSLHEQYGADAIPVLRSAMLDAIESRYPLPPDFALSYTPEGNAVILTDTRTNKKVRVGLCDLHGALLAIRTFCGRAV